MQNISNINIDKLELMLSTAEVSQLLHVHPNTLRRWSDNGLIKSYRINPRGDRRFRQGDIDRFLLQLKECRGNPHKCAS